VLFRSRVADYSQGMTQRLALCRAFLHEPELLILDEPFSSLDQAAADLLERELGELSADRTLVVSAHDTSRVDRAATSRLVLA